MTLAEKLKNAALTRPCDDENQRVLWSKLVDIINSTPGVDRNLGVNLWTFWQEGTKLVLNAKGDYVLRPVTGQGIGRWDSEEEYGGCRDRWLKQHSMVIGEALKKLKTS